MTDTEFDEKIAPKIALQRLGSGKERTSLDWEHIRDLRSLSPEFRLLFEWISYCLSQKRAYAFTDYQRIQEIDKKTAKLCPVSSYLLGIMLLDWWICPLGGPSLESVLGTDLIQFEWGRFTPQKFRNTPYLRSHEAAPRGR